MPIKNKRIIAVTIILIVLGSASLWLVYNSINSSLVYKAKQQLVHILAEKLEGPNINKKDSFISINYKVESAQEYGYHIFEKVSIQLVYGIIKRSGLQDATGWQMKPAEYLIYLDDINIGAVTGTNFILLYTFEGCTVKFDVNDKDTMLFSGILEKCRNNAGIQ